MRGRDLSVVGLVVLLAQTGQAAEQAKKTELPPPDGVTWQHGLSQDEEAAADKKDISPSWQHGLSNWGAPATPAANAAAPSTPPAATAAVQKPPPSKVPQAPRRALKSLEKDESAPLPDAPPASQPVSGAAAPPIEATTTQEKK